MALGLCINSPGCVFYEPRGPRSEGMREHAWSEIAKLGNFSLLG